MSMNTWGEGRHYGSQRNIWRRFVQVSRSGLLLRNYGTTDQHDWLLSVRRWLSNILWRWRNNVGLRKRLGWGLHGGAILRQLLESGRWFRTRRRLHNLSNSSVIQTFYKPLPEWYFAALLPHYSNVQGWSFWNWVPQGARDSRSQSDPWCSVFPVQLNQFGPDLVAVVSIEIREFFGTCYPRWRVSLRAASALLQC